jgi:hypothetical protein
LNDPGRESTDNTRKKHEEEKRDEGMAKPAVLERRQKDKK